MRNPTNRIVFVLIAAAIGLSFLTSEGAAADLYRYVDKEGQPHAVSDLYMVPAEYRDAAVADLEDRKSEHRGSLNIEHEASPSPSAHSAPQTSPAPAAPRTETPRATPAADGKTIGGHEEFWWHSQAELRRKKLAQLNGQLEAAREDEADWSNQIYRGKGNHAGPGKRGPGRGRNRGRAALLSAADDTDEPTIEEIEKAVQQAEEDLNAFEDGARSAGVPPGWLR